MHLELLRNAAHLYRLRAREQPLQELLAVLGIAAGVALLFAVQVASTSLTGSLAQLAEGVTGKASLEVAARGPNGMDQRVFANVKRQPGVRAAAPVVQRPITVAGPRGGAALTLLGVDDRLREIGGPLVKRFISKRSDLDALGFFLTADTAKSIGAVKGQQLTVTSGANTREVILAGTLGADEIGAVSKSPIALAPLGVAQKLTGMQGRISRILVEPQTAAGADPAAALRKAVGEGLAVRPSNTEVKLLAAALKPDQQSSAIFSAIAVIIGMLFAYNAMLMSASRRARVIAQLRMIGADKSTIRATLALEAILLGVVASAVGIFLGDFLSRVAFHSVPLYLASGFPIGAQRVVEFKTLALSMGGGLIAALLASAQPAFELSRIEAAEAGSERGTGRGQPNPRFGARGFWIGVVIYATVSIVAMLWPAITPVGIVCVFAGLVLLLGPILKSAVRGINRFTRTRGPVGFAVALDELASTPTRSVALALIAAVAVTATMCIGGVRLDLARGVDQLTSQYFGSNALWVESTNASNVFVTQQFDPAGIIQQLRGRPGIEAVDENRWTFLDAGGKRLLVIAPPPNSPRQLVPSQVLRGDPRLASERIRSGGWVALSSAVANQLGSRLSGEVVIPTPSGDRSFRLAAVTANHGWPSGSIVMNSNDYQRDWKSGDVSALSVQFADDITSSEGKRLLAAALGTQSALRIRTSEEMVADRANAFTQGLARLRQISLLVLGTSILAIVAAMFAAVWQRRNRLASLRAIGMNRHQLFGAVIAETSLIVVMGGLGGIVFGLYGQFFTNRWTTMVTGYRAPFEPAIGLGLVSLFLVAVLALIATAGPASMASRIAPSVDAYDN